MPTPTSADRLSSAILSDLPTDVDGPEYDRDQLRRSIVHIGVGGFHRAHLATYVDELCRGGNGDWSIVGAGVLPGDERMATALGGQDHLYTLITRGADQTQVRVIGSIVDFVHAPSDPAPLVDRIASPDTQIVSLTVTEGGYPIDDTTGEFRPDSPNAAPGSAFAVIAAGLERRRSTGGRPITVLSCDNILGNGSVTRTALVGLAAQISPDLSDWVRTEIAFPNSMVDRITPATSDADRTWLAQHHGIDDRWPVVTEPFRQWVVEDHFAGDRLPLESLDVIVTDDVEPYEMMKLRLLNAGHSCLAYLSALAGIVTVDDAMADPEIREFVRAFLEREALPAVPEVAGIDLRDYIDSLVDRFSNPNIGDQISRLCLDGSAKFPKFLMPTIAHQLGVGGPIELSTLALAGWCQYLVAGDDPDSPVVLSPDPSLDEAVRLARASIADPTAFLEFGTVFDEQVRDQRFAESFAAALTTLRERGVRSAIERALADTSP